ncbi:hypothetical protein P7K49_004204 [Saguinus oedipus]|uniref:BHLH domain-containing protein n=1 Tax=Saguinus oedipus TaxID=9490 RepID=A0ABQ9W6Q0_SAGOE|nr:hypothetical protein P7K49_004204 [Saguinus oedipus]
MDDEKMGGLVSGWIGGQLVDEWMINRCVDESVDGLVGKLVDGWIMTGWQARNSCPGPLDSSTFLSSDFLLPEDPKPRLPPLPAPPPLMHYPHQAKGPGLEPCPPPPFHPMTPPAALLQEEPLFSPRFPFPTVPPAPGVSLLPAPAAFPSTPQPVPSPAPTPFPIELLPSGYPEPAFGPCFSIPRGKPPTPSPRGQKASPPTLAPATASPPSTAGSSNPCLTQLLTAAKPEQSLEPPPVASTLLRSPGSPVRSWAPGGGPLPAGFTTTLRPSPPQQEKVPEFPCTFLPPTPAPTPPRPPPGPATLAPSRPLLVPKVERLSPPAPSGSERRLSGDLSSMPGPGTLSVRVSPPQPILSRGRPDSNKSLPGSFPGSAPPSLLPETETRRITHISAEQKRRFNIKLGFDTLHGLVSTLSAQPSLKVSKATTLQKTAEYILMLQQERASLQEEAQQLRDEIEELNAAIK